MEDKIIKKSEKRRRELGSLKANANLVYRENCTHEENKKFLRMRRQKKDLPEGVYEYYKMGEFFRIRELDLTDEELIQYTLLKQNEDIKAIKSMVMWILVIMLIPVGIYLLMAMI